MEGFNSKDDARRIECIKEQIDGILSSNATVTKVIDNIFEVDLGTRDSIYYLIKKN